MTTTGATSRPGDVGELLLRNPTVTPGYWQMPEETAAAVVDGWLHTGDLVTANVDGTYTFVSRVKEVLRRRGLNLSPTEVEEAIAAHPDVLEVAVVAVPSELTEDEVKAFVVAVPDRSLDFAAAAGLDRRTALRVQGPPVLAGPGRPPAHADLAGRQAPPPRGPPGGRVRRPARRSPTRDPGRALTGSWPALDAEEQVEVPVGQVDVAAHGAAVDPPEGPQHEAGRVELDQAGRLSISPAS